jgi:hypothetical protein
MLDRIIGLLAKAKKLRLNVCRDGLTTRNLMHFVLDEVVNQRNQCSKEQTGHDLAVLNSATVIRAKRETTQGPRQGSHQVRDHKNVMPIMVVGRCHIGPTSTSQSPEDAHSGNQLGKSRVWARSEDVPQKDEGESWTGSNGDKDLEEGSFGITIADSSGHGGKPFDGVAVMFILNNLVVMQSNADNQRAEERRVRENRMSPSYPFTVDLQTCQVSGVPISAFNRAELTATTASPSLYRGAMAAQRQKAISTPLKLERESEKEKSVKKKTKEENESSRCHEQKAP